MNELDDMLLRIDQEEALMTAFDEERPLVLAYFDDALKALLDGGVDLEDQRIAMAFDELRCNKAVAEADYVFRIGLLIGSRLRRRDPIDYGEVARLAAYSVDERLGIPEPRYSSPG